MLSYFVEKRHPVAIAENRNTPNGEYAYAVMQLLLAAAYVPDIQSELSFEESICMKMQSV